VDWRGRAGDVSYRLGATVGYASFREDGADYFPNDPARQAELEALADRLRAGGTTPISTSYPSQSVSGFIGGVRAELDWAISPTLSLSGAVRYDKSPDFDETRFLMRLQNRF
jgi:hypothetical protein